MAPIEFMIRFVLSNQNVDVALVGTTNEQHLAADIDYAAKGPLDPKLYAEAKRRLDAAGGAAVHGKYRRGGPTPVM